MSVTYSAEPVLRWGLAQRRFTLVEPIDVVWLRKGHEILKFRVEAGFSTDLASIPQFLQWLIPKIGRHLLPAICHDWIYVGEVEGMSKKDGDLFFLDFMETTGVAWWRRRLMYRGVRLRGKGHWG